MNSNTKKIVTIAILTSVAIVLSIVESFIPIGLPGIKLGLANAVVLITLYLYSYKEAFLIEMIRVLITGLIYSGLFSYQFLLSFVGALVSFIVMFILSRFTKLSVILISVFGAISHTIGQILIAYIYISSESIFLYLPIIMSLSIVTGILTGLISYKVLSIFKEETPKPRLIPVIITSILFVASITSFIVFKTYKSNYPNSIVCVTYNNERIMNIDLNNPNEYKIFNGDSFISMRKENDSYIFSYNLYNKDDKKEYLFEFEIKDKKVRVITETTRRHISKNMGTISNKYESLISIPNSFVISIESNELTELDNIM